MQTGDQICMKDAQSAEMNQKSIFHNFLRFLVFEIWEILYWKSEFIYYVRGAPPLNPPAGAPNGNSVAKPRLLLDWILLANWFSRITA